PPAAGRHHGGFQTSVRRGRHPLVFVNYSGNRCDVITLAHELGHAYQYWLLRDEPAIYHRLPPALAECVSTLAEAAVAERWLALHPTSPVERRQLAWSECQTIVSYLLTMPSSCTFEYRLHAERRKGAMAASDLTRIMDESCAHWFGSTMMRYDRSAWF